MGIFLNSCNSFWFKVEVWFKDSLYSSHYIDSSKHGTTIPPFHKALTFILKGIALNAPELIF